jgi:hypothetical protein
VENSYMPAIMTTYRSYGPAESTIFKTQWYETFVILFSL